LVGVQIPSEAPNIMTKIFILTYCKDIKTLYGNLLTFKTVRTGFKDAEIIVYDNNSIDEARKEIRLAAATVGAKYIQYTRDVSHHDFIKHQIEKNQDCYRIIFLHPDLVFWDSFDDFNSDALLVGRKIPNFYDVRSGRKYFGSLHTSFLIVNNPKKLVEKTQQIQNTYTDVIFYRPYSFIFNGEWYRYDTTSSLYSMIEKDCEQFTERELDKYDHLISGTHLDFITGNDENHPVAIIHKMAIEDINNIKGIWRKQEQLFLDNKF
jgi:hypothetical protein